MYASDMTEVFRLTGFSAENLSMLVRYYAELPIAGQIEAHQLQSDLVHRNRKKKNSKKEPEYFFSMFMLALHKMQKAETGRKLKRKGGKLTDEEAQKMIAIRKGNIFPDRKPKPSPKKAKIEEHYELIRDFRNEGVCWRDIAKYLARHHRQKISHTHLRLSFDRITTERTIREEA